MSRTLLARRWAGECTGDRSKQEVPGPGKAWRKEIMRDRPRRHSGPTARALRPRKEVWSLLGDVTPTEG